MRFRIEQRFPGSVDDVEAILIDPRFLERLASLPKLGKPELLEQVNDGDIVRQRVRYAFAGDLNSAARAVLDPARLTWVEESALDRSTHRTTFRIVPDHYADRLSCAGTFALQPDTDGATVRVAEGELKVKMPLVGGKVERAILSGLEEHAELEAEVVREWLQESR
ncbi:MAG TPA: DUF2505 family protein [Acidimicrobiales bacterium]|nr:DUF2505 family protein [Acidimicrobiales bacterium]